MNDEIESISKILTANDIGATGGHQAGITVPKTVQMLSFFPDLDNAEINPRVILNGADAATMEELDIKFIYYNGKLHGTSTRNEYRLTGLTDFFRKNNAAVGDELQIERKYQNSYFLSIVPAQKSGPTADDNRNQNKIKLTGNWSSYKIRKK